MSFTHTSSSNELWLSLRFPQLSLDLLQQTESQGQNQLLDQPTVIAKNSRVYLACDKAHALGISPGTSIHTALLLCEPSCDPFGVGQINADPVGIFRTNPTRTNPSKINPAHSQTSLLIRPYSEEKNHNALQQLAQQAYEFTPYGVLGIFPRKRTKTSGSSVISGLSEGITFPELAYIHQLRASAPQDPVTFHSIRSYRYP